MNNAEVWYGDIDSYELNKMEGREVLGTSETGLLGINTTWK